MPGSSIKEQEADAKHKTLESNFLNAARINIGYGTIEYKICYKVAKYCYE